MRDIENNLKYKYCFSSFKSYCSSISVSKQLTATTATVTNLIVLTDDTDLVSFSKNKLCLHLV
jgi:hypothetical protein